jgi:hypothetical protein
VLHLFSRIARVCTVLCVALILSGCGRSPEGDPETPGAGPAAAEGVCGRGEVLVFAGKAWYHEFESLEESFSGPFSFNPPQVVPGSRYRAFNVGESLVYGGDPETTDLMQEWVGQTVTIRGKRADVGFGEEIWPGKIACAE